MTGQLALDLGPIPVVEAHQRDRIRLTRAYTPPLRKCHMWWRGRRRQVVNVPTPAGVL